MEGNFVAYFRVSTQQQGRSGLGLDAQRKAVGDYLNGGKWKLLAEFTEVESGKRSDRPQLAAALALCKKKKAKLVIAKLDRLSRNLHFITGLMESKIAFVACDLPVEDPFMVHIYASVAQQERRMISQRTKAALQAAKARGQKLGGPMLPAINQERQQAAQARADAIAPALKRLDGISARAAAAELNRLKIATVSGAPWSHKSVIRARKRI